MEDNPNMMPENEENTNIQDNNTEDNIENSFDVNKTNSDENSEEKKKKEEKFGTDFVNAYKIENIDMSKYSSIFEKKVENDKKHGRFDKLVEQIGEAEREKEDELKSLYPGKLGDTKLEEQFLGILLNQVKSVSRYYFLYDECCFADSMNLDLYKKIIFTDGEKFSPIKAKEKFSFPNESQELYEYKEDIAAKYRNDPTSLEKVYTELKKVFIIRKNYNENPVKDLQDRIEDILNYELYAKMNPEDVESAITQITATEKFKRAVLNDNMTKFVLEGENTLTNGLQLPFPIMSKAFKGIRQGETAAFTMPSNYGKSRFTINMAAVIALAHKKKILIISNEMSEEKMKLCLITTIINNPIIQRLHGQKLHVSENQLLEFRFRPDNAVGVEVDSEGFVKKKDKETRAEFIERLKQVSSEFNGVIKVTDWYNSKLYNSIHFIDITDHTNDELRKVIMNYYYKEQVHYVFYDTLKTDIDNIGNGEELKKTATILSNLAQNYNMYICSSLQLQETSTEPLNLTVNDMAVSRTVKEVLDTLCLFKQIHNEDLGKYEYSKTDTFDVTYDLEKFKDPNVRYYCCVIDKNRAGPKPKLIFRLNLAYNRWEELGHLRLKSQE